MLAELCRDRGAEPSEMSVIVQGFGNVGSWAARIAHEAGFRVVGAGDLRGAVHNADGIDVPAFAAWLTDRGSAAGFPEANQVDADDLLTLECDVLVPAATGEVIDGANVADVRARVIVEAANHPVTAEADAALDRAGVTVVPDILANAGGVVVSYFEWTQNIQQFRWPESRVNEELRDKMVSAYRNVRDVASERGSSLREAAFAISVERVAQAIRLRGFV